MTTKDALGLTLAMANQITHAYLDDLSDADFVLVPVAGMNPIAWQIGHLIATERKLVDLVDPGRMPELPEGFADAHDRAAPGTASAARFRTKAEYMELYEKVRAATTASLAAIDEAKLDEPGPEPVRHFVPTVGALFNLLGAHYLMHCGQWVAVRRQLQKPVAM